MKKLFILALTAVFMWGAPALKAQAPKQPLIEILNQFGQVSLEADAASDVYTFSASLSELTSALEQIASCSLYLSELSLYLRPDGKAAVSITALKASAPAPVHYRLGSVVKFLNDKRLSWKQENSDLHGKYELISLNSNLRTHFTLTGQTLNSALIFSLLMPVLEGTPYLKSPFFQRGTYSDTPNGERLLTFTIGVGI